MPTKEVDIIIPTMDNPKYLGACLASLEENTRGVDYRVIVYDNGTKDKADYARAYQIFVIGGDGNVGWERGLQRGLDITAKPLVLFLNDDVVFLRTQRNWLKHLVDDMADPLVAAAGPMSNMVAGPQSNAQALTAPRYRARYLIGFCLLVRRSALDEVGGIDTTLPGGDDIDLSIRLRQAGYTLVCDRRSFVYHYGFRTGERVHGDRTVPGGWNSPQMIAATRDTLIAKHGEAAFTEAWRNDPLGEYHAPQEVGV